jgi:hypothetical protein
VTVLRGVVSGYDQRQLSITADDGQLLTIELGNSRYNRSLGFAPQVGELVTVEAFILGGKTDYNALTITFDSTGQTYTFRDALGNPLWAGKNAQ